MNQKQLKELNRQIEKMLAYELKSFDIVNSKIDEIIEARRKEVSYEENIQKVAIKRDRAAQRIPTQMNTMTSA